MKLSSILLVLLWNNVELTLTQKECLKLPTVEHAFVSDQYKKAEYQEGDVIYFSCDPGYTTGLNTTYVCTEHGWRAATIGQCIEYTVPVPLGCTPPPPLKHGYVLNNSTYFYGNGQRVVYRCNHSYTLKGGPHKTCTSGQWTGNLQCLSTTCEKPLVDNGEVQGDKETFVVNEVLTYSCDPGYRKVDDRPSVCLKIDLGASQWSPMPECEAITCKLSFNPPEGTTYDPPNQILFKLGQTVRVSCGEKQWVKSKELQSAELTCQDTGHWDFEPVCQLVTCSKTDENVYYWQRNRYSTVEMGETLSYRCRRGYEDTSRRAKCTRRGWEPDPLCKATTCEKPLVDNGEVQGDKETFVVNEVLTYSCDPGYRKVDDRPSVCLRLYLRTSQWSPRPQCEAILCQLSHNPPNGTTYDPPNQIIFQPGQRVRVSCGEKQWVKSKELQSAELTCQDTGHWDFEPVCQLVTCFKIDENIYHWQRTQYNTVEMDETLWYRCHRGYEETSRRAKCTRRGWEPDPLCKLPSCEMPLIDNGVALPQIGEDGVNMILIYTCNEGYKKVNTLSVCRKLGLRTLWSPRPQCEAITCKLSLNPLNQLIFNPGQSTRVLCGEKQWVKSKELQSAELTCQDTGRWDFDPECQQVTCSKTAENVYWEHTYNNTVEMGRILRYMCYPGYHNTGRWAKCTRQGWEPDPLCKVAQ